MPKTILFVDDERNILSALRRLLRREGWDIRTATGGREGLALLQDHPVDLVVSDMRMPEMDGPTFLKKVKELYPDTIRIALTAYADHESVTRAFDEAGIYQVISKPWDDEELKEVIGNALQQSESQEEETAGLHRMLNEIDALPTLPQVYLELRRAVREADGGSTDRVARIIAQEPAIAAKILQIANSSFFGQRRQVETISRAIVVLGLELVENLVLSTGIFQVFEAEEIAGFDLDQFWRHSIGCGAIARLLEERVSADRDRLETALLAGTLHDLGKLVFARFAPDRYAQVVNLARKDQVPIFEAEEQLLGVAHPAMGGYLADWWSLPAPIVDAIRWHYQPAESQEDPELTALIHLADALAHQVRIGASGNGKIPDIHASANEILALGPADLDAFTATLEQRVRQGDFLSP